MDTIKDFHRGSDHIDLRDIDANTRTAGNQAFTFIGNNAFHGKAGSCVLPMAVAGDTNGDKIADFCINVLRLRLCREATSTSETLILYIPSFLMQITIGPSSTG